MSSANVFLKMTLLTPEPVLPVRLVRHAAGRRAMNGRSDIMTPLGPVNGERYAVSDRLSSPA